MNKSPAATFLLVVLLISSLLSVLFCGLYISNARRLRDVQRTAASAQAYLNMCAALVSDTVEYSKKDPSIDPILEAAGIKLKSLPNKPPAK